MEWGHRPKKKIAPASIGKWHLVAGREGNNSLAKALCFGNVLPGPFPDRADPGHVMLFTQPVVDVVKACDTACVRRVG
jgi:hypothetical protein